MDPIVRMESITKRFGALTANEGIDFTLNQGRRMRWWAKTAQAKQR